MNGAGIDFVAAGYILAALVVAGLTIKRLFNGNGKPSAPPPGRMAEQVAQLHDWHNARDHRGRLRWHNDPEVEEAIKSTDRSLTGILRELKRTNQLLEENLLQGRARLPTYDDTM